MSYVESHQRNEKNSFKPVDFEIIKDVFAIADI